MGFDKGGWAVLDPNLTFEPCMDVRRKNGRKDEPYRNPTWKHVKTPSIR